MMVPSPFQRMTVLRGRRRHETTARPRPYYKARKRSKMAHAPEIFYQPHARAKIFVHLGNGRCRRVGSVLVQDGSAVAHGRPRRNSVKSRKRSDPTELDGPGGTGIGRPRIL